MDRRSDPPKKEAEVPPPAAEAYVHESAVDRLAIYENLAGYQEVKDYLVVKYGTLFAPPPELMASPQATMVVRV